MMVYLMGQTHSISYQGCASQLFFYHFLGCNQCFLYTMMAYDHFAAICHPVQYMSHHVCVLMTLGTWLASCMHASVLTFLIFRLPYCGPNEVHSFFCDISVVLPLACADTSLAQIWSSFTCDLPPAPGWILWFSVCVSYKHIGIAILRIRSAEGRRKAFSTCSAHLTAILCAYGPVIIIYLQRTPNLLLGAVVQILNNIVSSMLNSLIYSLRNKEVKNSLKKIFQNIVLSVQE
ncbi:Olfactory receptor 148 [Heterocephalus glaber]|uniref:Olfactory receptor 148 n=1 Tax=Heterocephalus glaber TaxID=10181 RepID=G5C590_HETGA|nr:Olfactory receptor 148 [Heterocephalus glaber]